MWLACAWIEVTLKFLTNRVNTSAVCALGNTGRTGNARARVEVTIKTLFCSPLSLSSFLNRGYHQVLTDRSEHIRSLRPGGHGMDCKRESQRRSHDKTLICLTLSLNRCLDESYQQVLTDRGEHIRSLRPGGHGMDWKRESQRRSHDKISILFTPVA